ncbi:hypothetical protein BLNAU_1305 [Blattamonas nauphoetae]|uniref:Uncharacterized protein n=1 Tax=Blattamonas nauphoetae TaxID=2049346 RepID=A0ABQ9YJ10_9EUKA|nr:hypothetical protein BLNAU_1305 [Blattamonas nauphoetae]
MDTSSFSSGSNRHLFSSPSANSLVKPMPPLSNKPRKLSITSFRTTPTQNPESIRQSPTTSASSPVLLQQYHHLVQKHTEKSHSQASPTDVGPPQKFVIQRKLPASPVTLTVPGKSVTRSNKNQPSGLEFYPLPPEGSPTEQSERTYTPVVVQPSPHLSFPSNTAKTTTTASTVHTPVTFFSQPPVIQFSPQVSTIVYETPSSAPLLFNPPTPTHRVQLEPTPFSNDVVVVNSAHQPVTRNINEPVVITVPRLPPSNDDVELITEREPLLQRPSVSTVVQTVTPHSEDKNHEIIKHPILENPKQPYSMVPHSKMDTLRNEDESDALQLKLPLLTSPEERIAPVRENSFIQSTKPLLLHTHEDHIKIDLKNGTIQRTLDLSQPDDSVIIVSEESDPKNAKGGSPGTVDPTHPPSTGIMHFAKSEGISTVSNSNIETHLSETSIVKRRNQPILLTPADLPSQRSPNLEAEVRLELSRPPLLSQPRNQSPELSFSLLQQKENDTTLTTQCSHQQALTETSDASGAAHSKSEVSTEENFSDIRIQRSSSEEASKPRSLEPLFPSPPPIIAVLPTQPPDSQQATPISIRTEGNSMEEEGLAKTSTFLSVGDVLEGISKGGRRGKNRSKKRVVPLIGTDVATQPVKDTHSDSDSENDDSSSSSSSMSPVSSTTPISGGSHLTVGSATPDPLAGKGLELVKVSRWKVESIMHSIPSELKQSVHLKPAELLVRYGSLLTSLPNDTVFSGHFMPSVDLIRKTGWICAEEFPDNVFCDLRRVQPSQLPFCVGGAIVDFQIEINFRPQSFFAAVLPTVTPPLQSSRKDASASGSSP